MRVISANGDCSQSRPCASCVRRRAIAAIDGNSRCGWAATHIICTPTNARWLTTEALVLALRPNCECCNRDLPPESTDALICTFECTFCRACATEVLKGICPNCSGELVTRPRRPAKALAK